MNKYCIKSVLGTKLSSYIDTLKEISYDTDNKQYLCEDVSLEVYNFDKYIENNFDRSKLPASPDGIYIGKKDLYFIEFKNSNPSDIDKKEIDSKFEKGTQILKELLGDFTPKDIKFIFCVVYKNQKTPKVFNPNKIEENAIKFRLEVLNKKNGNFYNTIYADDVNYYKNSFKKISC